MIPALAQELPDSARQLGNTLPDILLGYQKELLQTTAVNAVTVYEKSRRIGITWGVAADAVLTSGAARSAGGMDTLYIGYNLDMAREFIDTCGMWAKAFLPAASEVQEFLFADTDDKGADRAIQAFRIVLASGFEIVALTSKPRSLRGRQGYLILDEAAFHDDLGEMLKAGMAFLMWGGKILVISTHDGETNPFAELVNDCRAGRKPYALLRTTFDAAIDDGLYERVAMTLKARGQKVPTKEDWIGGIRDFYGEDGDEELDCIPAQGSGAALSGALIELRMDSDIPVLRWEKDDAFSRVPVHIRDAEAAEWCEANLKPLLDALPPDRRSFFGEDFGRLHDLTVIWPILLMDDTTRRPPFVVELSKIPFEQQKFVLFYIVRRLPRFMAGALDAGGNGAYLAEVAADEFGHDRIAQVKLSLEWYRENMPRFVAAFEDGTIALPRDANLLADHRSLKKIKGIIRVPDIREADARNKQIKRHGDSAIAHALGHFASIMEIGEYAYEPATGLRRNMDEGGGDTLRMRNDDDTRRLNGVRFNEGAW